MSWRPSTWRQPYFLELLFVLAGCSYFVARWSGGLLDFAPDQQLETFLTFFGLCLWIDLSIVFLVDFVLEILRRRRPPET